MKCSRAAALHRPDSRERVSPTLCCHAAAGDAGPERGAGLATAPLEALQDYLAGRKASRRGDYFGAMDLYGRAFARDSTFVLAASAMVAANAWQGTVFSTAGFEIVPRVWRMRGRLGARDLDLLLAWAARSADALDRLDSLMRSAPHGCMGTVNFQPTALANLTIARYREAQGDIPGALATIRRREVDYFPAYLWSLPAFLRQEGRLAALTRDTAAAVRTYDRYLAMRTDPEPALRPQRVMIQDGRVISAVAARPRVEHDAGRSNGVSALSVDRTRAGRSGLFRAAMKQSGPSGRCAIPR